MTEIKPVNWRQFRSWSHEEQKAYLAELDERYAPTADMYARMFNTTAQAVGQYRCRNDLAVGKRGRKSGADPEEFEKFLSGETEEKEEKTVTLDGILREATKLLPEGAEIHVVYRL